MLVLLARVPTAERMLESLGSRQLKKRAQPLVERAANRAGRVARHVLLDGGVEALPLAHRGEEQLLLGLAALRASPPDEHVALWLQLQLRHRRERHALLHSGRARDEAERAGRDVERPSEAHGRARRLLLSHRAAHALRKVDLRADAHVAAVVFLQKLALGQLEEPLYSVGRAQVPPRVLHREEAVEPQDRVLAWPLELKASGAQHQPAEEHVQRHGDGLVHLDDADVLSEAGFNSAIARCSLSCFEDAAGGAGAYKLARRGGAERRALSRAALCRPRRERLRDAEREVAASAVANLREEREAPELEPSTNSQDGAGRPFTA
eukprot:6191798-Pleurochrysis_carterae.AAC.1